MYCSRACSDNGLRATSCKACGSPKLHKKSEGKYWGWCHECLKKHRREYRENRGKVDIRCISCGAAGHVSADYSYMVKKSWLCPGCRASRRREARPRKTYIKICRVCRTRFATNKPKRKLCSVSCRSRWSNGRSYSFRHGMSVRLYFYRLRNNLCVDCGGDLNERTHAHTLHRVCNYCMWKRRSLYKDKAKFRDQIEAAKVIRFINLVTLYGLHKLKRGDSRTWEKQRPLYQRRIKESALRV